MPCAVSICSVVADSSAASALTARLGPMNSKLITTALRRGLRKRCPHCGEGPLFSGWSHLECCSICGLIFVRNPGDTWAFTIIGDRLPIAGIIVLIYFGVMRSHPVLGLTHDGCVGGAADLDVPQSLGRRYRAALPVASVLARTRGSYPAVSSDRPFPEPTMSPFDEYRRKHTGGVRGKIAGVKAAPERKVSHSRPAERVECWYVDQLTELDGEAKGECHRGTPRQPDCRRDRSNPPCRHRRPERVPEHDRSVGHADGGSRIPTRAAERSDRPSNEPRILGGGLPRTDQRHVPIVGRGGSA